MTSFIERSRGIGLAFRIDNLMLSILILKIIMSFNRRGSLLECLVLDFTQNSMILLLILLF